MTAREKTGEVEYTADQLEQGIYNALKARNMEAVVAILQVLRSVDLDRCVRITQEIQDGLTVARVLNRAADNGANSTQESAS